MCSTINASHNAWIVWISGCVDNRVWFMMMDTRMNVNLTLGSTCLLSLSCDICGNLFGCGRGVHYPYWWHQKSWANVNFGNKTCWSKLMFFLKSLALSSGVEVGKLFMTSGIYHGLTFLPYLQALGRLKVLFEINPCRYHKHTSNLLLFRDICNKYFKW